MRIMSDRRAYKRPLPTQVLQVRDQEGKECRFTRRGKSALLKSTLYILSWLQKEQSERERKRKREMWAVLEEVPVRGGAAS